MTNSLRRLVAAVALLVCVVDGPARVSTQSINPELLTSRWAASWIRHKGAPPRSFGVYLFRRSFDLPAAPSRFVVHASADQRYELFVNGHRVATGPARGDLDHWRFETIDIAKQLASGQERAGRDRLELRAGSADGADQPSRPGSCCRATATPRRSSTPGRRGARRRIPRSRSFRSIGRRSSTNTSSAGPARSWMRSRYPWGWEQPAFDDTVLGRRRADHDRRAARDSRHAGALVPRAAQHSADGRHAGAAGKGGAQRGRRGSGGRARRQRALGDPGGHEGDGACSIDRS